jgi:hypothetical protein
MIFDDKCNGNTLHGVTPCEYTESEWTPGEYTESEFLRVISHVNVPILCVKMP